MNEQRKRLEEQLRQSAYTGRRAALPTGITYSTRDDFVFFPVRRWLILLVVLILLSLIPASSQAAEQAAPLQTGCDEWFDHHDPNLSPYFERLFSGKVWTEAATGSVIAAVWVAECRRYLIGIWRNGYFTTHFLASWGYIINQLRGFVGTSWGRVWISSPLFILTPCPGTWSFTCPCPSPGGQS